MLDVKRISLVEAVSYWLSVIVFFKISQMFNQSSQGGRKFLLCPVDCGVHGKILSLIPAIIHKVYFMWVSKMVWCWHNPAYSFFYFHSRVLQVSVTHYRYQGHCRDRSLCFHSCILFLTFSLSVAKTYLGHWGSFVALYFLTLQGKWLSCGRLSSICSSINRSLRTREWGFLSLPQNFLFLGCLVGLSVFLQQKLLVFWILCCVVRTTL